LSNSALMLGLGLIWVLVISCAKAHEISGVFQFGVNRPLPCPSKEPWL
jgi:hypothetical protein